LIPLPDKESPAEAGQVHPGRKIKMKRTNTNSKSRCFEIEKDFVGNFILGHPPLPRRGEGVCTVRVAPEAQAIF
jgi:hypothetical protein